MNATSPENQKQIDLLSDVFRLIKSLIDESERAAVILAAARLDVDLERLLKHVLQHHPGGNDPLFEGDRMLGTFSAKIAFSYRLGLISSEFEHSLQMLRKIRNDFAHQIDSESLSSIRQKGRLTEIVRVVHETDIYKYGFMAFKDVAKSPELLQLVLSTVCMTTGIHAGMTRMSKISAGSPIGLS